MKRLTHSSLLLALLLVTHRAGHAQLNSVPVLPPEAPNAGARVKAALTLSGGVGDDSGKNPALTLSTTYLIGKALTVGGGVGLFWPVSAGSGRVLEPQGYLSAGVGKKYSLKHWTLVLQPYFAAGLASFDGGRREWSLPVGVSAGFLLEPVGYAVEGWLMPRLATRITELGPDAVTQRGPGFSLGVRVAVPAGLGAFLAVDWADFGAGQAGGLTIPSRQPVIIGGGIRLGF